MWWVECENDLLVDTDLKNLTMIYFTMHDLHKVGIKYAIFFISANIQLFWLKYRQK